MPEVYSGAGSREAWGNSDDKKGKQRASFLTAKERAQMVHVPNETQHGNQQFTHVTKRTEKERELRQAMEGDGAALREWQEECRAGATDILLCALGLTQFSLVPLHVLASSEAWGGHWLAACASLLCCAGLALVTGSSCTVFETRARRRKIVQQKRRHRSESMVSKRKWLSEKRKISERKIMPVAEDGSMEASDEDEEDEDGDESEDNASFLSFNTSPLPVFSRKSGCARPCRLRSLMLGFLASATSTGMLIYVSARTGPALLVCDPPPPDAESCYACESAGSEGGVAWVDRCTEEMLAAAHSCWRPAWCLHINQTMAQCVVATVASAAASFLCWARWAVLAPRTVEEELALRKSFLGGAAKSFIGKSMASFLFRPQKATGKVRGMTDEQRAAQAKAKPLPNLSWHPNRDIDTDAGGRKAVFEGGAGAEGKADEKEKAAPEPERPAILVKKEEDDKLMERASRLVKSVEKAESKAQKKQEDAARRAARRKRRDKREQRALSRKLDNALGDATPSRGGVPLGIASQARAEARLKKERNVMTMSDSDDDDDEGEDTPLPGSTGPVTVGGWRPPGPTRPLSVEAPAHAAPRKPPSIASPGGTKQRIRPKVQFAPQTLEDGSESDLE